MSHGKLLKKKPQKQNNAIQMPDKLPQNSPQASCLGNDVHALVKPGTK